MANTTSAPVDAAPRRGRKLTIALVAAGAVILVALLLNAAAVWSQVTLLGLVEGFTEFLPISSTGHLLIARGLLNFEDTLGGALESGTFEIFIQLGAVIAVLAYYARELLAQVRDVPRDRNTQRFWLAIAVAFVPAAAIGLLFHKAIKTLLYSPSVIAASLIAGGILFIAVENWLPRAARVPVTDAKQTTVMQAIIIGVAQVLALVPGVSRSGATIVGAMLAGLDRKAATTFSFYLAIPTLGIATVFDLLTSLKGITAAALIWLGLGTAVAFVAAWLSIGWLLRYVSRNTFVPFGVYRILAGLAIIVLMAMGLLR